MASWPQPQPQRLWSMNGNFPSATGYGNGGGVGYVNGGGGGVGYGNGDDTGRLWRYGGLCACLMIAGTLGIAIAILIIITTSTVECTLAPLVVDPTVSGSSPTENVMLGMQVTKDLHCGCESPHCPPWILENAETVGKICNCTTGRQSEDVLAECICPNIEGVCGKPGTFPVPSICGVPASACTPTTTDPPTTDPKTEPPATESTDTPPDA